ncbi:ADP-ribosylglycohydrolase family protein [Candidatus Poribacteria bacterium]|nr:ADP-ribosylglycohydrolase family protein [Candidatus Poribacteria bacterium]
MQFPHDYAERVYAGVLGKIIGVYLGRPFEGWTYERIMEHLGEVDYYVHDRLGAPLVVTDDDISGTFTFFRALEDYGHPAGLSPQQIGQTWLNYLIEERTILWWGGIGNSTEHTAYLRLKRGIPAPRSGSADLNSKVVAEQIGSRIFIDAWGMMAPANPELAVDFAKRAASVSHDGEAIYGAQVVAAMVAQAFVEPDVGKLLDTAVRFIPTDCVIRRLIDDVREWHAGDGDWKRTRERIAERYGYDTYGGNVHMVPNHALIILGLLYGDDDFQRALMVTNTAGWDTDCNSGNVGCIMAIKDGLDSLNGDPDWRGPVADRLYLSTAEGGRGVSDAAREAAEVVRSAHTLAGASYDPPKDGAWYHFEFPGSVQGFAVDTAGNDAPQASIENVAGHSVGGTRSLAVHFSPGTTRVTTPVFIPPDAIDMKGYRLFASPRVYPGQTIVATVAGGPDDATPASAAICALVYDADNALVARSGSSVTLPEDGPVELRWDIPDLDGAPIAAVGIEIVAENAGTAYVDCLTWDGTPDVAFKRPDGGTMWQRAWVDATDQSHFMGNPERTYRVIHNEGTGLLTQGTREWQGYRFQATVEPHLCDAAGIAVGVQGLKRYYGLLLDRSGTLRLVKELDGHTLLAERAYEWKWDAPVELSLDTNGRTLVARADGEVVLTHTDDDRPLLGGGVGLVVCEGRVDFGEVRVLPIPV